MEEAAFRHLVWTETQIQLALPAKAECVDLRLDGEVQARLMVMNVSAEEVRAALSPFEVTESLSRPVGWSVRLDRPDDRHDRAVVMLAADHVRLN